MQAHTPAHPGTHDRPDGSRRVVQHGRASTTTSIAQALVVKDDELFFLCETDGDVPMTRSHGLGLYYHDCRYLNGYELRLGSVKPERLMSTAAAGTSATVELTNPDLQHPDGSIVEKESIAITWNRAVDGGRLTLEDAICLTNFGVGAIDLTVSIALRTDFESLFEVRGANPKQKGTPRKPAWNGRALSLEYDGADGVFRALTAHFDPAPARTDGTSADFAVHLEPRKASTLRVRLQLREAPESRTHGQREARHRPDPDPARQAAQTSVRSDSTTLDRVIARSLQDLELLRTTLDGDRFFAAGVPWYVTLFGRDSLIAALEVLAFTPEYAAETVRLLARYQGVRDDAWRDEAPGKIMHELRQGEMAHLDEIPQTPYYGSIDATPLFLILLSEHAAWTGRLDLFTELRPHVDAALEWIDRSMHADPRGYLAYTTASSRGLSNQGWKDSGDAIMNDDGSLATPPIALVEVQGYVYLAKRGVADLCRRAGDQNTASRLAGQAEALRDRFEQDFWLDEIGTYALALQKDGAPARVVSSNPGQALWTGIARRDRAERVARRLLDDDMFTGWGVRTLSSRERRYNPIGYHTGTVWPHDNAIAAAGFRRYGCSDAALRLMKAIVEAATRFDHDRLPEVFAGFTREQFDAPVHYPVACHPQAWAAGAVPFMLQSALGLRPDAFDRTLHVSAPVLPDFVQTLTIERLRVGDAQARLVFRRSPDGTTRLDDAQVDGPLQVHVE